jgi:hypothetical protein
MGGFFIWKPMNTNLQSAADFLINGTLSNGATWQETFSLSIDGAEIEDADTSSWRLIFKKCDGGSVDLTLSSGSEITVTQNTTETIFEIDCPQSSLSNLCGDYFVDLVQKNGADIFHRGSGRMTVNNDTLWVS